MEQTLEGGDEFRSVGLARGRTRDHDEIARSELPAQATEAIAKDTLDAISTHGALVDLAGHGETETCRRVAG